MVIYRAQKACGMHNTLLTRSSQALIDDEIEEYEQTIADLSAHLQADPTNAHALNNCAVAHGEIGHLAEALAGFRAAAAADPANAVPHVNMGQWLAQLGYLSEAIAA
jgi:Tfp pilus assembly protein PilF